ncbi:hypothetical protein NUU61_001093 [Penicillium alfredii]|uniref:Uncharacterized protein n=1 Tax=Penicillium alfredii TaxID=1506179 RepID=A0A9W9KQC2_9EURO|nr:uncharacterized protein NUU61_001093 [Penicillium alfredii]KAJ5115334.1 hypothetical protein NUU61_001093 [Penicillium alfredii]
MRGTADDDARIPSLPKHLRVAFLLPALHRSQNGQPVSAPASIDPARHQAPILGLLNLQLLFDIDIHGLDPVTTGNDRNRASAPPPKSQEDTPPVSTNLSRNSNEVLHLEELELMMHWCTTTYRSMARDDAAEPLWQTVIPHLSLRHPALRHGLLALSALHLAKASGSPERKWRYMVSAREHQTRALAGIELDEGQDLTTAQCNATFALCCVMITFAFGYCLIEGRDDTETDEQLDVLDEFLEIFQLTRWLVCVMIGLIDRISAGELSPLVRPEQPSATMPDMSRLVILSLRRQNGIEGLRDPAHERDIYDQAIGHLGALLEQLMRGGEPKMFAFCWSFRIPYVFLDLVRRRRPFALIVLAHYAVVLYHLRDSWWMGDWGTRVLEQIGDCLDSEWRQHLSWPINATGCFLPES